MFANKEAVTLLKSGAEAWNAERKQLIESQDSKDMVDALFKPSLIGADFSNDDLQDADLSGFNLSGAHLQNANLSGADLSNVKLGGAELQGTNFENAILTKADFRGAKVNFDTNFTGATVDQCSIDRNSLDFLNNYGGLSKGDRMKMNIRDDIALLRNTYSGFWQWIHLAALFIFLFPYLWFIAQNWAFASFYKNTPDDFMMLGEALAFYIFNGGKNWQTGADFHPTFVIFVFAVIYNFLRIVLLFKTKRIELEQESTGLPVLFSLRDKIFKKLTWKIIFDISKYGFGLYLMVTIGNLGYFFTMDIPVNQP